MNRHTRNIVLAVATMSGFLATFTATAINVALPRIQDEFHLSAVVLDWIPLTYVLAAAAILMASSRAGDIFGRMRVFTLGLVGFTVFNFAAVFAPSGAALIALRTVQGLAASLIFATNIAIITLSQPPETRGRALGILSAGVYFGSTTGPVFGGLIAQHLGWRALFLFVGGLTLLVCVLTVWKLHGVDWKEPRQARFDALGSVVWAVALPALLLGLTFLPELTGVLLAGGGALGLAFFVWWETRAADPVLNVHLLRHNRAFAFSNMAALINYSATFAMAFLMSLYLHYTLGLQLSEVGYVLVSGTVLQVIVSPFAGRLADRLQPRLVAGFGQALCALALFALAFLGEQTPYWFIILALCVLGVGFGLFASPVAHMVMGSVDRPDVGMASATLATMRVVGQGVSMGISGLVLALLVGRDNELQPSDYPDLLTSVRISFAIFAGLCVLGTVAVLLGRRRPDGALYPLSSSREQLSAPTQLGIRSLMSPAEIAPASHRTDHIRNLAIIAHIDHGKTTLIDSIFRETQVFREDQRIEERVMDSNDLERERGITIRSKHCTVRWGEYLINIVDTPGHADFSGEVERVLSMVDSVLLLVDANEGPMPQTRYVLMRALRLGLRPIVVVNKVDRPNADPHDALNKTFDLFVELGATDSQADFPVVYGSALEGWIVYDHQTAVREGMDALFETIVKEVPPPRAKLGAPFRMQVSTLAWSDYLGRIGCGRVLQGTHRRGEELVRTSTRWTGRERGDSDWEVVGTQNTRSAHLWVTRGLEREELEEIHAGDIVWVNGPEELMIGDTLSAPDCVDPAFQPLEIEEPTVSMLFLINNSPFSGQDGQAVTLRQIKDRLDRELRVNVALRVEDLGRPDGVKVSGRGELHLGILIEEMRREGMELCVSRPEVITRQDDKGHVLEPIEELTIDVPDEYQGIVIEKLAQRKGELIGMHNAGTGIVRMEMSIPTRGLIGYRGEFLTDTRGLGIMSSRYVGHEPWRGEVAHRDRGSLVSMATGPATGYSLESLQARGTLFVSPMDPVYVGMIVGEHSRSGDLVCNPTKTKQLGNYRSENKEIDAGLKVPRKMSLDQALEWIGDDELVEVTPKSVRVRKSILTIEDRKRAAKN